MRAEEGGNLPQRVLLVGGPKHGEFMNLKGDQTTYEFTTCTILRQAAPDWPNSGTHVYKYDDALSRVLPTSAYGFRINIFTHEVLWDSPDQGGFNLQALSSALSTIEEQKGKAEKHLESITKLMNDKRNLESDLEGFQQKYEGLLELNRDMDDRLVALRQTFERLGQDLMLGVELTGRDYTSIFNA